MREEIKKVADENDEFEYREKSTFNLYFGSFGLSELCEEDQKEIYFKQNLSTYLKVSADTLMEKNESGVTEHPEFEHREKRFFNGVLWNLLVQVKYLSKKFSILE